MGPAAGDSLTREWLLSAIGSPLAASARGAGAQRCYVLRHAVRRAWREDRGGPSSDE